MRQIHTPADMDPPPYPHEMFAAQAVSACFDTDVTFIKRSNTAKSADLRVGNIIWEIKSSIKRQRIGFEIMYQKRCV